MIVDNNTLMLAGGAVAAYGALVHFWPTIKSKLPFVSPRVSKELEREAADLDAFVAKAHAEIDKRIEDLKQQKNKIAAAQEALKKAIGG